MFLINLYNIYIEYFRGGLMPIQHNIDSNAQGQRLRLIRNLTMLSRRAFAKKHNLNISAYQAWEDGRYKKGISLNNASKIISAAKQHNFNCTAEWLLYGIGEPPSHQKNINFHANINEQEHILKEAAINNKIRELNTCLINAIKENNLLECRKLIQ
jgi:DNA-binding transcriptional regulator YiaG